MSSDRARLEAIKRWIDDPAIQGIDNLPEDIAWLVEQFEEALEWLWKADVEFANFDDAEWDDGAVDFLSRFEEEK